MLKKILEYKLKFLAKAVISRYQPDIVGITGSVGKTTTRSAIASVLRSKFIVRENRKNYNNEIGLPLTILDCDSPGASIFGWLKVFLKAWRLILIKDKTYPDVLVLEMGIDRPGDMKYLTSIARPKIAVMTNIGQSHLEYFDNEDEIAKEKGVLVDSLLPNGFAVLNYDDERLLKLSKKSKSRVIGYGFSDKAKVRALEMAFSFANEKNIHNLSGMSFKLQYAGSYVPVHLQGALGHQAVIASMAAASVGIAYGFNLVEISQALATFEPPRGRMRLLPGLKNTLLIDDTYNASPQSCVAGLEVAGQMKLEKNARRIAILGDMLELGGYTVAGHQLVGRTLGKYKYDYLLAVGERALLIMSAAKDAGVKEDHIFHFSNSLEAVNFAKELIKENDVIFLKGSQGMRMEKITKQLLANPKSAADVLPRQDWPDA